MARKLSKEQLKAMHANRTHQARNRDESVRSQRTFSNTPMNRTDWANNPRRIDIEGLDAPARTSEEKRKTFESQLDADKRIAEANKMMRNPVNYDIEYGVEKNGKLVKSGFDDSGKASSYARDEYNKGRGSEFERHMVGSPSEEGYEIVHTKKQMKPGAKKEIDKLLNPRKHRGG